MTRQLRSAFPTNHALRRRRGQRHLAQFFQAEVVGVDFGARKIRSDAESFSYDYLILAPGSRTAYFGASGARENAIDLKGLRDALRVRNTIIDRLEEAERLRGAFAEGVEAAAGSHDLIFDVLRGDYPGVDFERVRLVLVNSGDHILRGLDPSLVHAWRGDGSGLAAMRGRDRAG